MREDDEYVKSIEEDLRWLGAIPNGGIYYGSDYFEQCYQYAEQLIPQSNSIKLQHSGLPDSQSHSFHPEIPEPENRLFQYTPMHSEG